MKKMIEEKFKKQLMMQNAILKLLHESLGDYLRKVNDEDLTDGVIILGIANFSSYVIAKMETLYQGSDTKPYEEFMRAFEIFHRQGHSFFENRIKEMK